MKYDFKCDECGSETVHSMSVDAFKDVKDSGVPCEDCGSTAEYRFNPEDVEVCYVGFQWADKNFREKKYRANRAEYMSARQKKNNFTPKLAPNYKGERTSSWKEARAEARSDGKFAETYDHLVEKEQRGE